MKNKITLIYAFKIKKLGVAKIYNGTKLNLSIKNKDDLYAWESLPNVPMIFTSKCRVKNIVPLLWEGVVYDYDSKKYWICNQFN